MNCNAGAVIIITDKMGTFGTLKVWSMPEGIANIFSMPATIVGMDTTWCTLREERLSSSRMSRDYPTLISETPTSKLQHY